MVPRLGGGPHWWHLRPSTNPAERILLAIVLRSGRLGLENTLPRAQAAGDRAEVTTTQGSCKLIFRPIREAGLLYLACLFAFFMFEVYTKRREEIAKARSRAI